MAPFRRLAAVHAERGGAGARHLDAHALEKLAHLHHVRLRGGVADLGHAVDQRGRQQRRLGAGDRRLIEVKRRRLQAVRRVQRMTVRRQHARPQRHQRIDVRADGAPGGKIAARHAQNRASGARQQRTQQQHGAAQLADQRGVGLRVRDLLAAHAHRGGAHAVHVGAHFAQQVRHHLDVADARHVVEHALFGGEQAGGEQRQRRVLVALRR